MTLQYAITDVVSVGGGDVQYGITDLALHIDGTGASLFAIARAGGDISEFDLNTDTLSLAKSIDLRPNLGQLIQTGIMVASDGDAFITGLVGPNIYGLGANHNAMGRWSEDGWNLGYLEHADMMEGASGEYIIGSMATGGVVSVKLGANKQASVQDIDGEDPFASDRAVDLATFEVNGKTFAIAAFGWDDALATYEISVTGEITFADQYGVTDGLAINHPSALETVEINGQSFVIVGSSVSSTLSVLTVGTDGTLQATDHIFDDLNTRFDGITEIFAVKVEGRQFVVATGGDMGLTIYALTGGGQLMHIGDLPSQLDLDLDAITSITGAADGNDMVLALASQYSEIIQMVRFDMGNIGETIVTSSNGGTRNGSTSDDILQGSSGNDTLMGRAGDDTLIDGDGVDQLDGGDGVDVYVFLEDGKVDRVLNYDPVKDLIDFTLLPGVWDFGNVITQSESWGATLIYGGERLEVYSVLGAPLTAADFGFEKFIHTDRAIADPTLPENVGIIEEGTDGADTLLGQELNDVLEGGSGNDLIRGEAGEDRLFGDAGSDTIYGGVDGDYIGGGTGGDLLLGDGGFDTIFGGGGNDTLNGGNQADEVYGGYGDDHILGEAGFDNLYGESGADTLIGGDTADRLYGGEGEDLLYGGTNVGSTVDGLFGDAGDDVLYGQGGFDMLDGGEGHDTLDGGLQADNLYGRTGDDLLIGGGGLDRLFGGSGNDTGFGGDGNDGLFGQDGDDILSGDAGDDRFFGGAGNDQMAGDGGADTLYGGAGFDTLTGGEGDDVLQGDFNADTFVFADGHGQDVITDFAATNDFERIDLSDISTITDFADLSAHHLSSQGNDAVIDTGSGSITLIGVNISELDALDFVF